MSFTRNVYEAFVYEAFPRRFDPVRLGAGGGSYSSLSQVR